MREILVSTTNNNENSDKNDNLVIFRGPFLTNNGNLRSKILNSPFTISVELCSNRAFNTDLLKAINPVFCSLTYLNENSINGNIELGKKLLNYGYPVVQHLAGRTLTRGECDEILNLFNNNQMFNIFALRGDDIRLKDDKKELPYAGNLVNFIRNKQSGSCIFVAGYPDGHPLSKTPEEDYMYLKKKVLNGVDFIVTQAVFTYKSLDLFRKRCREIGITTPIIAGLYVITSYQSLINMIRICSLKVPSQIMNDLTKNKDNKEFIKEYGLSLAVDLIKQIYEGGFKGIHIFTLNNLAPIRELKEKLYYCSL